MDEQATAELHTIRWFNSGRDLTPRASLVANGFLLSGRLVRRLWSPINRCFRHQLLLGRQRHSPSSETGRRGRFEECE